MTQTPSDLLRTPFSGRWQIAGAETDYPGTAWLEDGHLMLKLYAVGAAAQEYGPASMEGRLAPPARSTLVGHAVGTGAITLFDCVMTQRRRSSSPSGLRQAEITLTAHEAWLGDAVSRSGPDYVELGFEARGLHAALSTAEASHLDLEDEISDPLRKAIKQHSAATLAILLTIGARTETQVEFRGKTFRITLATTLNSSLSVVEGDVFATRNNVWITCQDRVSSSELLDVMTEVERLFSIFCMGSFQAENIYARRSDQSFPLRLLWRLGVSAPQEKTERMPHQLLVRLSDDPKAVETALVEWFAGTEQRRVARWLICESLAHGSLSAGTFLAVAQAWEIIGREIVRGPAIPRSKFSEACDAAQAALAEGLGDEDAKRLADLIRTANKPSFRRLVEGCMNMVPAGAVRQLCGDAPKFVTDVVQVRNALTHMQDGKITLNEASTMAGDLTLKLITLYCLIEARAMKLPMNKLDSFLRNNQFARMAVGTDGP